MKEVKVIPGSVGTGRTKVIPGAVGTGHFVKELTGHTYFGSPHESASNCGTCDGARCDFCREVLICLDCGHQEDLCECAH